jgi:S1-C subfamily serine protease
MVSFFFRRNSTKQRRITIIGVAAVTLLLLGLGFFFFPRQITDLSPVESELETATTADLGITYLQVTPGLSDYYGLGVSSGVLVTEVVSGSPADRTGVQVGDVILSYNGVKLEGEARLLGMMMSCPAGNKMTLEIWREKDIRTMELFHADK